MLFCHAPLGQPAREHVEQRGVVVQIVRFVPGGAYVAAGHPAVARDGPAPVRVSCVVSWVHPRYPARGMRFCWLCAIALVFACSWMERIPHRHWASAALKALGGDCPHRLCELWKKT